MRVEVVMRRESIDPLNGDIWVTLKHISRAVQASMDHLLPDTRVDTLSGDVIEDFQPNTGAGKEMKPFA